MKSLIEKSKIISQNLNITQLFIKIGTHINSLNRSIAILLDYWILIHSQHRYIIIFPFDHLSFSLLNYLSSFKTMCNCRCRFNAQCSTVNVCYSYPLITCVILIFHLSKQRVDILQKIKRIVFLLVYQTILVPSFIFQKQIADP